ncbi:unnamed protein product [Discula destructiva]
MSTFALNSDVPPSTKNLPFRENISLGPVSPGVGGNELHANAIAMDGNTVGSPHGNIETKFPDVQVPLAPPYDGHSLNTHLSVSSASSGGVSAVDYTQFAPTSHCCLDVPFNGLDIEAFRNKPPLDFAHGPMNDSLMFTGLDLDLDLNVGFTANGKPSAMADLTSLLARMSQYEASLSKVPSCELGKYPIGDAIFLPEQFCGILSAHIHHRASEQQRQEQRTGPAVVSHAAGPTSAQHDPPTLLLTLCCYMTLLRIYSAVFRHLRRHLTQLAGQQRSQATSLRRDPFDSGVMYVYRGLRLDQLQHTAVWGPAQEAVSILLGSLGDAERLLRLPPDVRIVTACPGKSQSGESSWRWSPSPTEGEEAGTMVLFDDGFTNERLYLVVVRLANELRDQVDGVKALLKELCEM